MGIDTAGSALPWVVLAVVVLALAGLAALAVAQRLSRHSTPTRSGRSSPDSDHPDSIYLDDHPDAGYPDDDLAAFRDHPPGTAPWVPVPAPATAAARPPAGRGGRVPPALPLDQRPSADATRTVLVLTASALVLLGAAAAVAGSSDGGRDRGSAPRGAPPGAGATDRLPLAATVTFAGVVLEQHAVGITAGYPQLTVFGAGPGARAQLTLTSVNCLATEPPTDPRAAGCSPTATEYADLRAPDLEIRHRGAGLELSGEFATSTGAPSAPLATGRSYQVSARIEPTGPVRNGRAPARGVLGIDAADAPSVGRAAVNELRYAG